MQHWLDEKELTVIKPAIFKAVKRVEQRHVQETDQLTNSVNGEETHNPSLKKTTSAGSVFEKGKEREKWTSWVNHITDFSDLLPVWGRGPGATDWRACLQWSCWRWEKAELYVQTLQTPDQQCPAQQNITKLTTLHFKYYKTDIYWLCYYLSIHLSEYTVSIFLGQ